MKLCLNKHMTQHIFNSHAAIIPQLTVISSQLFNTCRIYQCSLTQPGLRFGVPFQGALQDVQLQCRRCCCPASSAAVPSCSLQCPQSSKCHKMPHSCGTTRALCELQLLWPGREFRDFIQQDTSSALSQVPGQQYLYSGS